MFVSLIGTLLLMAAPAQDMAPSKDPVKLAQCLATADTLVIQRQVGYDLHVEFYGQKGNLERLAAYHANGTGYCIWYRQDGTRSHRQQFGWRLHPYLQEGRFGIQYELQFFYAQVDQFDKTGRKVEQRLMFHANGATIRLIRQFRSSGATSLVEEYRFDGTLKTRTEYPIGKPAKRSRYSQADAIKPNVDPALLTVPNTPPSKS